MYCLKKEMNYWWVGCLSQYRVAGRRHTDFAKSLQESVEDMDVSVLLSLGVIFGLCCSALPFFVTGLFPFCLIEKWWKLWVIRSAGRSGATHLKLTVQLSVNIEPFLFHITYCMFHLYNACTLIQYIFN